MVRWRKWSPEEVQLAAHVQAWMKSRHRRVTNRQAWISHCWGSCQGGGNVPNCLTYGCCVAMEEHFPPGYSKAEVKKRWEERSWWEKLWNISPKLPIPEYPPAPPPPAPVPERVLSQREIELVRSVVAICRHYGSIEKHRYVHEQPAWRGPSYVEESVLFADYPKKHEYNFFGYLTISELQLLLDTPPETVPERVDGVPLRAYFEKIRKSGIARHKDFLSRAIPKFIEWGREPLGAEEEKALALLPADQWREIERRRVACIQVKRQKRQDFASLLKYYGENKLTMLLQEFQRASAVGGLQIFAPSGWGKSILLGALCAENAKRGIATVLLDASGAATANVLDLLARIGGEEGKRIEENTRYCNMAGEEVNGERFVTSWPILRQRFEGEDLYTTSQRFIDLIAKTQRSFSEASIQGMPRLRPLLTSVSMVLSVLGLPMIRAVDMLSKPVKWEEGKRHPWKEYLERAEEYPDADEAVRFLREEFLVVAQCRMISAL